MCFRAPEQLLNGPWGCSVLSTSDFKFEDELSEETLKIFSPSEHKTALQKLAKAFKMNYRVSRIFLIVLLFLCNWNGLFLSLFLQRLAEGSRWAGHWGRHLHKQGAAPGLDRLLVGPHRATPDFGGVWEPRCLHNRQGELRVSLFTQNYRSEAGQDSERNVRVDSGCKYAFLYTRIF